MPYTIKHKNDLKNYTKQNPLKFIFQKFGSKDFQKKDKNERYFKQYIFTSL